MKLPICAHSHSKDHVNMVNATIWSLFMFRWHIMPQFHSTILQDVDRECLIKPVECVTNLSLKYLFGSAHVGKLH